MAFRFCVLAAFFATACLAESRDFANDECTHSSCAFDTTDSAQGSAMLQIRRKASWPQFTSEGSATCSLENAKQQPLTEAGFEEISKSCCYEDVKAFARRLIDDMGLKVCDEGGLSGIVPFYSCPPNPVSLADLKEDISKASPAGGSKCTWIDERYAECKEPALECGVSAQKPFPAPKPVASGFIAFKATNPSEMLRSSSSLDALQHELALAVEVPTEDVNVILASGPLDGEEVVSSFLRVPKSQGFFSLEGNATLCKVFAVFSVQEPAPKTRSLTTPAPALDEKAVVEKLKHLDADLLGKRLTQDLGSVDKPVGDVEVMEETVCEKTSLKCTHAIIKEPEMSVR